MGKQTVSVNSGESGSDTDNNIENEDTSDEDEEEESNEEDPDEDEPYEVDPYEEADEDSCGPNDENFCDKELDGVASCEEEPNEEDSCEEEPNEVDSCGSPSDLTCSKEKSDQLSEEDEQSEEETVEGEPDMEEQCEETHCEEEPIQEELDEEEEEEKEEPLEEEEKEEPLEEEEEEQEEEPLEEVEQCEEEPSEEEPEEDEQCEEESLEEEPSEEEPEEEEISDDPEEPCERSANQSSNRNKNPTQSKSGKMNTSSNLEAGSKRVSKTSGFQNSSNNVTADARMSTTVSSGKKRPSKWDVKDEAVELPEDGATKKRKTRWSRWANDDSQVSTTTPLQHPNVEIDIDIPKLQAQLFDVARKLQTGVADDRPPSERSPSPPPIYNNLGIQINTREARIRSKLMIQRQSIISELIRKSPNFKPPPDYKSRKISKKLYIPSKEYPEYNFVGIILGPCGNTLKRMEKETGARIYLRGRGSQLQGRPKQHNSDTDDLHVLIEANNKYSLDSAVAMVKKLLIPVEEGRNELKRDQLRELAEMRGTVRGNSSNFKNPNPCNICGEASHATSTCPLTAPGPGVNSNGQHADFFVSDPPLPIPAPPPIASSASVLSKPKKEIDDANLYVGCLPQSVDDNVLIKLFCHFGPLSQAKVVRDRITNVSKGYGFVKYTDHINAAKAVAHMHGYKIDGKMLIVRIAGILPPPVQTKQLPTYPSPAVIVQNNPYPMSWASLTESQNNPYPMSRPGPSEYQNTSYPMSWPGPPESRFLGTVPSFSNSTFSGLSSVSLGPLCQTPTQSSLFSSDFGTSNELTQFPGYIKSLDFESTPSSTHSPSLANFSQEFSRYQMPPT